MLINKCDLFLKKQNINFDAISLIQQIYIAILFIYS